MATFLRSRLFSSSLWLLLLVTFVFVYIYTQNSGASTFHDDSGHEGAVEMSHPENSPLSGDDVISRDSNEAELEMSRTVFHKNQSYVPENMPYWLGKYPFMPAAEAVADENRICYVHVGKTAGSTTACLLGFSYGSCPKNSVKIPSGNLSFFTTNMIHKEFNDCKDKEISRYLFIVRDPLSRMQSWFTYERPDPDDPCTIPRNYARQQKLFFDCPFPNLNALGGAEGLGSKDDTICKKRAWQAITGSVGYTWHNMYNYEYYLDEVLAQEMQPKILVLRTEHLERDWSSIESNILGGPPLKSEFRFPHRHKSAKEKGDLHLSVKSKLNICRALCAEIQVYKQILAQAENLDEEEVAMSMKELEKSCPREAKITNCQSG